MRHFTCVIAVAALLVGGGILHGESPPEALNRLKAVGREGVRNESVSRAWKEVIAQGPDVLPALLGAMDDADLTSANWLRTAGDVIAEKALANKRTLPTAELEQFVRQTRHNSAARRLAYEWLCRVDPKTPERLLPGMVQDPSPELRRDAVAVVMKQAEERRAAGDKEGAKTAYRKAFEGACDKDQVDGIVAQLDKLGMKVDVAAHFGFVKQWLLVAPFEHRKGVGFNVAYPPEKSVDPKATYKGKDGTEARWTAFATTNPYGTVDLNKALGKQQGVVAYAFAVVESPSEQEIQIHVGSPNGIKVFLNGKQLYQREEYHHGSDMDQHVARSTLKKGRNELLIKIAQNEQKDVWAQEWTFQARLCNAVGAAVPFTQEPVKQKEAK